MGGPRIPPKPQKLLMPELWVVEMWGQSKAPRSRAAKAAGSRGSDRNAGVVQVRCSMGEGLSLGLAGVRVRTHTSALGVCVHASMCVCARACMWCPQHTEYWHCLGVQTTLPDWSVWGSLGLAWGTHAWGTNPERPRVGEDVQEGPSSTMAMPLRLSFPCWGPEWTQG